MGMASAANQVQSQGAPAQPMPGGGASPLGGMFGTIFNAAANQVQSQGAPTRPTPGAPAQQGFNPQAAAGWQAAPTGGFNVNQAAAGGLQQAMQGTRAGMGYQPMAVQPGQIAGANLGAYTNPYESQVVQQSLQDIGGAQQQAMNQLGAQATAARAFGGSRHGIAEAETNRAFIDQAARMASGLRQQGYGQAQQLAGQDIATRMQAQLANQAAQLQANQQRLGAAGQMGGLGQQAFQTGQAINQQQMQQGAMQQALQQQLINAARQQYSGFTGAPTAALNAPLAALGVAPYGQTTTQTQQPGLFQWLTPFLGMM